MSSRSGWSVRALGLAGALCGAGASLGGCASEGVDIGRNKSPEERAKAFPVDYQEYAKVGYRMDWRGYPAVTGSLPVRLMQPYKDIVVTVEGGSIATVLEANTGTRRCSDQLATPLTRFVGIARDEQRVLVASDADVYALDSQTCNMTGRQKIEKIVDTEPVMFNDLLIFGTGTGEVLAHMTKAGVSGVKAWGFGMTGAVEHRPALVGNIVGAVAQSGQVVFLDAQTGSFLGKNFVYSGLMTDPVADANLFYVASLDQSIYAFNPTGGSLVWRVRTASPLRVQPTAFGGRLYCTVPGQGLTAFDSANGQVVWTCKGFNGTVVGTSRKLLVGFDKAVPEIVTIDMERGDVVARTKTPGAVMVKPDAFENGNLYVLSGSGLVAKFVPVK
jgi:outer membrane protein assembly factor BamB